MTSSPFNRGGSIFFCVSVGVRNPSDSKCAASSDFTPRFGKFLASSWTRYVFPFVSGLGSCTSGLLLSMLVGTSIPLAFFGSVPLVFVPSLFDGRFRLFRSRSISLFVCRALGFEGSDGLVVLDVGRFRRSSSFVSDGLAYSTSGACLPVPSSLRFRFDFLFFSAIRLAASSFLRSFHPPLPAALALLARPFRPSIPTTFKLNPSVVLPSTSVSFPSISDVRFYHPKQATNAHDASRRSIHSSNRR
mmetsp:Transcript_10135/g.61683  ORF Transcript_10135/g.61683 Transcript_10135/m.61683 type:complete len:246 (+) Transcript_10135:3675-4412(+)